MDTFLIGPDSPSRDALSDALERRQYATTVRASVHDVTHADAYAADLVVLCAPSAPATAWTEEARAGGCETLVVAVAPGASHKRIHALFAAGVDDCIVRMGSQSHLDVRLNAVEQYHATPVHRALPSDAGTAARTQAVVADVSRRALSETHLDVLMAYVAHVVPPLLGVDACKILEHEPARQAFSLRAGAGWTGGHLGTVCIPERCDSMLSQAGYTLASGGPVVAARPDDAGDFAFPSFLAEHGMQSGISVPIASSPKPFGVLGAHARTARAYDDQTVFCLQSMANVLAGAVEHARTKQALQVSEANAHAILETTVDGIITIDANGHIESFNEAAEDIFGYDAREVIGRNVRVLMPEPYREEHDSYIQRYHETGEQRIIGIGREVTGQRKDGSTFPMDLAVSEVQRHDRITFTGVVRDISERRRLEQEILSISEQERRRIGQDLHDGLGQMLTGTGLLHKNLADRLQQEDHPMASEAAEITDLIRDADQYARDLARGLTPVDLEASGLSEALRRLSHNAERLFDVECVFEEAGTTLVHNSQAATHLYRITQEAVSNAVRHGEAERIRIILAGGRDQIRLRVYDNGSGFDVAQAQNGGMGLRIMQYRARVIGGSFDVSSTVDRGTTVTCTLPRTANTQPGDSPPEDASESSSNDDHAPGTTSMPSGCPI